MAAKLLKTTVSLLSLLIEIRYTLSRLLANPLTVSFAPAFQDLRGEWATVQATEIALNEDLSDARAKVDIANATLDEFAARFSNAILALNGQRRDAPLYRHFFKKPLSEFRRPVLGAKLRAMDGWILSLESTPHASLADMKDELELLVEAGKEAEEDLDTAVLKIRDFRQVGERYQLFVKVNAKRKETHGALGALGISTPGLPSSFQDQFFKLGDTDEREDTVDSVEAEIRDLEERLAERNDRLAELKQEAADEVKAAEAKAQKLLKLAELEKDLAAKKKAFQALKDELT